MRLTENQLRRIIRSVIKESTYVPPPINLQKGISANDKKLKHDRIGTKRLKRAMKKEFGLNVSFDGGEMYNVDSGETLLENPWGKSANHVIHLMREKGY